MAHLPLFYQGTQKLRFPQWEGGCPYTNPILGEERRGRDLGSSGTNNSLEKCLVSKHHGVARGYGSD